MNVISVNTNLFQIKELKQDNGKSCCIEYYSSFPLCQSIFPSQG